MNLMTKADKVMKSICLWKSAFCRCLKFLETAFCQHRQETKVVTTNIISVLYVRQFIARRKLVQQESGSNINPGLVWQLKKMKPAWIRPRYVAGVWLGLSTRTRAPLTAEIYMQPFTSLLSPASCINWIIPLTFYTDVIVCSGCRWYSPIRPSVISKIPLGAILNLFHHSQLDIIISINKLSIANKREFISFTQLFKHYKLSSKSNSWSG